MEDIDPEYRQESPVDNGDVVSLQSQPNAIAQQKPINKSATSSTIDSIDQFRNQKVAET